MRSPYNRSTGVAKLSKVSIINSDEKTLQKAQGRLSSRNSINSQIKGNTSSAKSARQNKSLKKAAILYPNVNQKSKAEISIDNPSSSQLKTLNHHLNIISQRRAKLIAEINNMKVKVEKSNLYL